MAHPLYRTARWQALRRDRLSREPLCTRCMAKGKVVPATVVHHRRPHKGNEELFFDPRNLESVCKDCHDGIIQQFERVGFSKEIGVDGWPVDPAHPANLRP